MVKVVRQSRREAAVEAEKRTLSLPEKSVFGQPLLDLAHESAGSRGAVFNSERFIFGQIRPLLIRSADRPSWYDVSHKHGATNTQSDLRQDQDTGRAVAAVGSSSSLSKFAIADFLRYVSTLEVVMFRDGSRPLGKQKDSDCAEERHSVLDAIRLSTRGVKSNGLRWLVATDDAAHHSNKGKASISDSRTSSVGNCSWNNVTEKLWCLLIEDCFGTAPIWYQQSMATGPPTTQCSLRK